MRVVPVMWAKPNGIHLGWQPLRYLPSTAVISSESFNAFKFENRLKRLVPIVCLFNPQLTVKRMTGWGRKRGFKVNSSNKLFTFLAVFPFSVLMTPGVYLKTATRPHRRRLPLGQLPKQGLLCGVESFVAPLIRVTGIQLGY